MCERAWRQAVATDSLAALSTLTLLLLKEIPLRGGRKPARPPLVRVTAVE
jgi:hypothetical protein